MIQKYSSVNIIISILIFLLLIMGSSLLYAHGPEADEALSGPTGVLPDSILFGADRFFESLGDMFTLRASKKLARQIDHMNERVREAGLVIDKGRYSHVSKGLAAYRAHVKKSVRLLEKIDDKDAAVGQIATNIMEHREFFAEFSQKVGDTSLLKTIGEFIKDLNGDYDAAMEHASDTRRKELNDVKELFDVEIEEILGDVLIDSGGEVIGNQDII